MKKVFQQGFALLCNRKKVKSLFLILFRAALNFFLVNVAIVFAVFIGSTGYFGFHIEKELIVLPLFYVLPPILYIFFEEYHQEKKERIAALYSQKPSIFRAFADSLGSRAFWISVLPLLLLLFFFDIGNVLILLCPKSLKRIFLIRTLFEILLYLIPEAVLLLFAEGALRRDWYRCWKMNCFQKENGMAKLAPLPKGRGVFNVVSTVFGGALIHIFFLTLLGLIGSVTSLVLRSLLSSFLLLIVLVSIPFLRWKRVSSSKACFRRKIEKFARERGFRFVWQVASVKKAMSCSCKQEFVLETEKERIVGTFLPVHSKRAILYFLDEDFYCFEKRFFWWWIFYPRHKYGFEGSFSEKTMKKVLIFTKESGGIQVGDEDVSRSSYLTDTVNGYVLHTADTFFNYVERLGRLY